MTDHNHNSYDALIAALDYIQIHSNEKAIREKAASALSQTVTP